MPSSWIYDTLSYTIDAIVGNIRIKVTVVFHSDHAWNCNQNFK